MNKDELKNFIYSHFNFCDYSVLSEACWRYTDYDSDEDCGDEYYDELRYACGASWIEHGCSKLVLGFDELYDSTTGTGYVIKIPMRGERRIFWDDDGEEHDREEYEYSSASSKNVVIPDGEEWNYCEAEAIIYSKAVEWNLDKIFAATEYICSIQGIPFYISEFVYDDCVPYVGDIPVEVLVNSRNFSKYSNFAIGAKSFSIILPQYGEEFCCDLIDFIAYFDIGDLHENNMGVTKDGIFKIFDYSDYRN